MVYNQFIIVTEPLNKYLISKSSAYLKYYKLYKSTKFCNFKCCQGRKKVSQEDIPVKVDRNQRLDTIVEEEIETSDEENQNV